MYKDNTGGSYFSTPKNLGVLFIKYFIYLMR